MNEREFHEQIRQGLAFYEEMLRLGLVLEPEQMDVSRRGLWPPVRTPVYPWRQM